MATYEADYSTGAKTLSTTTADQVTLYGTGARWLRITNHSGTSPLHIVVNKVTTAAVAAQGTLTMDTEPTVGDTLTIGDRTYTYVSALTGAADEILAIGVLGFDKPILVSAINGTGDVTLSSTGLVGANRWATAATFSGNDMVLTAKKAGTQGDLIATTETFTAPTNVFDAATLGTTTAGADAVIETATVAEDRFVIPGVVASTSPTDAHCLDLYGAQYGIANGWVGMSIVGDGNVYSAQLVQ